MVALVLVDVKSKEVDRTFDYLVPSHLEDVISVGQRVKVPFGPRIIMGYVLGIKENSSFARLRNISSILDITPTLTEELIELGKEMSISNTSPLVSIYQAMLPAALKSKYIKKIKASSTDALSLAFALKFDRFHEVVFTDDLKPFFKEIKKGITEGYLEVIYDMKQRNKIQYDKEITLLDTNQKVTGAKQKEVIEFLKSESPILRNELIKRLNVSSQTLKSLVTKKIIKETSLERYREINSLYDSLDKNVILNIEQQNVYDTIKNSLNTNEVFLLHGVTGSGKTEIYLNIIEDVLAQGKEAIMLVPEISLTPMMTSRFKGRFGDQVALLHSRLSMGEKFDEWRKIRRKEVTVCVGARSAIFAPFENLGLIIIDEEHTDSYKQDTMPTYHAKEVALLRSIHYNIPLILGSATPSIDSYYDALQGKTTLLEMKERANKTNLPKVFIEDMRYEFQHGNRSIFSKKLNDLIIDRLEKGEQIILLLNRRGHSTFVMCRSCGEVIMCPNCDISLTYHEQNDSLECHYCGHKELNPSSCPYCESPHIRYMGIGTERVEAFTKKEFPNARVIRMDTDTTTTKNAHEELLYEFEHRGDILIGTQMIAKGLDFPRVSLVGVLAADMSLNLPDYKAIEKTFQLLTQVSGRAGRHDIDGEVVIQTYNPDHYAIMHAKEHDYHSFYNTEIKIREISGYTPINQITQIIVSDKDVKKVLRTGTKIVMKLRRELEDDTIVLGPVLPKIARINNFYRAQIIIKFKTSERIDSLLKEIYQEYNEEIIIAIDKHPSLL